MARRKNRRRLTLAAVLAGLFAALPAVSGAEAPLPRPPALAPPGPTAAARDLFALPRIDAELQAMQALAEADELDAAAAALDALAARHPTLGALAASRAMVAMLTGDGTAALDALEAAVGLGFPGLDMLLAEPAFAPLAADPAAAPRLAALAARAAALPPPPPAVPAVLAGGAAPVEAANTAWNPATGRLEARFDAGLLQGGREVLGSQQGDAAYDHLRELYARGRAAGNLGDLYDNRDRGHSRLPAENHPQLGATRYGAAARAADIDYGLADRILFDRPTLGNSSTAFTAGPFWRSLVRDALTGGNGSGPLRLFESYAANQLYVYPAHEDYGAAQGDLFPANTPYAIVSQGSSRSDQPFLEACAMILAAFRPDTKTRLIEEGLLASTVQFVFRRSQRDVLSREDYFSGKAHPAAFPAHAIGLARMVSLANAIAPDEIPPRVRIRMLEEPAPAQGVDFFGEGLSEVFFDTPSAIGRIARGKGYTRSYLVSAEETADPNGRPLAFHWRLLQGDPSRVRITPLSGSASARIEIDWHEPRRISDETPVVSSRVDVGVFAWNGAHDSAPAILSVLFPAHETRRYEKGPDGALRIAAIDHADPAKAATYADPMLMARADWRDDFRYAPDGRPLGWVRTRPGHEPERFAPDGARVLEEGEDGRPLTAEAVAYPLARAKDGRLLVEELSSGRWIHYGDAAN